MRDVEQIAAEEIAADEERSRDWVAVKAGAPFAALPGAAMLDEAVEAQIGPRMPSFFACAVITIVAVVALIAVVIGFISFLPPSPGVAVATPTPTPAPTDAPTTESPTDAAPTATASPLPTEPLPVETASPEPLPEPRDPDGPPPPPVTAASGTFDETPRRDFVRVPLTRTDSGEPIDDGVTGITRVTMTLGSDATSAVVNHQGPSVNGETGRSRGSQVVLGRGRPVVASGGALLAVAGRLGPGLAAPEPEIELEALAIFFWELHAGQLRMGALDPATGEEVATEADVSHHEPSGTFSYRIPASEVPVGADAAVVASFHSPQEGDERRFDVAGPFHLHAEWQGAQWTLDDTPYARPQRPGSFIGVSSEVALVDEQGNGIGPAPDGHPAQIGQTDFQVVGDHLAFCASLPNMTADVDQWVVDFSLGDGISGFWRRDDGLLRMRAQRVDGSDLGDAQFLGDESGERVCIGVLREDAVGIARFGVTTHAPTASGDQPARHSLERDIDPPI